LTGKKSISKDDTSIELIYCTKHNFGSVSKGSIRQKEHIKNSKGKCKFAPYDPKIHNPKYDDSEIINSHVEDEEEKKTDSQKILEFTQDKIVKKVRSNGNHSNVYGIVKINDNYKVIFLGSKECIQWLNSEYFDFSGKTHSPDLYKNVIALIIAQAITKESPIEEIHNRIAYVDNVIYYNLSNKEYELVVIDKNGYSIVKNDLDTPMFRKKSSPLPQLKPKNKKNKNPLDELVELLKIPRENRQLFKIHLISLFISNYPIPIMILHGEKGSAKSTITDTVKKIVDPSPQNRNSLSKNVDNLNIHVFNHQISNFDNISYIDHEISDELCKIVTGHAYNKRELYTDDGEVILAVKGKILLNGVTPNIEYPDLMDRSIFYESVFIPEHQRLTEEEFNKKINELTPYVLDQVFTSLSFVLKNIESIKPEIKLKKRMADFTVFGECISRSLGYEKNSFLEAYDNNLTSNSLRAYESWPIINILLEIIRDYNKDFEISIDDLFKKCKSIAFEKSIDTKSQFSKFPKNESGLSAQITRLNDSFRNSGYDIVSYRYNSRDGKYKRGTRILKITSSSTSFFSSLNKSGEKPVSVVSPVSVQKQARNKAKSDTGKKSQPVSVVSDTNQVKSNKKNGTKDDTGKKSQPVSKKAKSVPKNGTDTATQVTQPNIDPLGKTVKTRKTGTKNNSKSLDESSKKYTHFKCLTCNAGEFGIDEKGTNSESILQFHKKQGHSINYFNYKEGNL